MSVVKLVFSKTAYRVSLKLVMKLCCVNGKKLMEPDFWEKNLILGMMPQDTPKIGFFWILQKKSPLICRFFGFKSCTIVTNMILLKLHAWKKSGSQVKFKNALGQSDCRILISQKLWYLKNYWSYKIDFLHAGTYLLKLQNDDVILNEWGQACPGNVQRGY